MRDLTSRERVLKALQHEEPDCVPFDLSSTPVTGIHQLAYRRLRQARRDFGQYS